jgi:hypothetical protein
MANQFITPGNLPSPALLSSMYLGTYRDQALLANLFNRTVEDEFGGGTGNVVSIRKQPRLEAKKFDPQTGIEIQDVREDIVNVTIEDLWDISILLEPGSREFEIDNWLRQVVEPAAIGHVEKAEALIGEKLGSHSQSSEIDSAKPIAAFTGARKVLNKNKVPLTGRFAVVGVDVAEVLQNAPELLDTSQSGSSAVLREANLGRIKGMPVYESNAVADKEAYVCHTDAITPVAVVPVVPFEGGVGATLTYDGFGVRVTYGYNQDFKRETVSFDHYFNVEDLRGEGSWVRLTLA